MRTEHRKTAAWKLRERPEAFSLTEEKRFAFYEKLYFHELDMREKLHARVSFPLTIVVSMIGAIVYLWQARDFEPASTYAAIFAIALGISFATILWGASYLVRSYWGHTYSLLPTAKEISEYRVQLSQTYEGRDDTAALVDSHFKSFLMDYLIALASLNQCVNQLRAGALHRCHQGLIIGATLLLFASSVFFAGVRDKMPTKVELTSPVVFKSMEKDIHYGAPGIGPATTAATPTTPSTATEGDQGRRQHHPSLSSPATDSSEKMTNKPQPAPPPPPPPPPRETRDKKPRS